MHSRFLKEEGNPKEEEDSNEEENSMAEGEDQVGDQPWGDIIPLYLGTVKEERQITPEATPTQFYTLRAKASCTSAPFLQLPVPMLQYSRSIS